MTSTFLLWSSIGLVVGMLLFGFPIAALVTGVIFLLLYLAIYYFEKYATVTPIDEPVVYDDYTPEQMSRGLIAHSVLLIVLLVIFL